jgi:hypothetical protein
MRLFCDQCGQEFTERTLRPDSNFCSFCGKPLTDYIKQHCHILRAGQGKRKAEGEAAPGRGRPRKYPVEKSVEKSVEREEIAVQDEYSTEENPESGGDEPVCASRYRGGELTCALEGIGEGEASEETYAAIWRDCRFSKTIQTDIHITRQKGSPPLRFILYRANHPCEQEQSINSLAQILNSAPISGAKPPITRATEAVPITVAAFRLPTPYIISTAGATRPFRRDTLSFVLGGSQKTTFPYPRNRQDGPPYACLKEAEQELLPAEPGEHGVIVVKSLPETLDHKGFHMFRKNKGICEWIYMGKYRSTPSHLPY